MVQYSSVNRMPATDLKSTDPKFRFEEVTHFIIIKWRDTKIDLTNSIILKFNLKTILQHLCKDRD